MEPDIFIPTLRSFTNENTFSGSCGMLRFFLKPDTGSNEIYVQIWHGIYCLEKSTIEEETSFPLSVEGIVQMKQYLESKV